MNVHAGVQPATSEVRQAAASVERSGREAAQSRWLDRGARVGMLARSVTYVLIAWLALQIALGHRTREANQNGALHTIAAGTGGKLLLVLLAVGFGLYALWRLTALFFGDAGKKKLRTRLDGLIGFVIYGGLCVTAVSIAVGAGDRCKGSARQTTTLTARVMEHSGGRAAVIIAGVAVVVAGGVLAARGFRKSFLKKLKTDQMSATTERIVTRVGIVGNIARGVIVVLVGVLLIDAGWTAEPRKSRGLDGALQTLAHTTGGPWLLGLVALGFLAFAAYSAAESRYRRTWQDVAQQS
jgi:hypothetical protein